MNLAPLMLVSLVPMASLISPDSSSRPPSVERTLEDFSEQGAGRAWRVVTDGVMGGISRGRISIEKGSLVFTGETRLENRGGFSSIRSMSRDWGLVGAQEIVLRIRGTSTRGYTMLLRTQGPSGRRTVSYWQPFKLQGDDWQTVRLPLADFFPNWRGRRLEGPALDPAAIGGLGLMVNDKKAGPFRVEIDWIKSDHDNSGPRSEEAPTIAELASSDPRFSTLVQALRAADLAETLAGSGPFTVVAPTNDAFAALPEGSLQSLLLPGNKDRLRAVLLHHVIPGTLRGDQLATAREATTALGDALPLRLQGGRLKVGEATVTANDLNAANGIVHVIDSVLIPSSLPSANPVIRLIETAVARGSELFNEGQAEACAAIYEVTATALLEFEASQLSDAARQVLTAALDAAPKERDHRTAAWTLRRALDFVLTSATG